MSTAHAVSSGDYNTWEENYLVRYVSPSIFSHEKSNILVIFFLFNGQSIRNFQVFRIKNNNNSVFFVLILIFNL